jgi:glutaredoxin 3
MNVTIYTTQSCPLCQQAKMLAKSKNVPYAEVACDSDEDRAALAAKYPGIRQFPVIEVNDQYVGGVAGLQAAFKQLGL